ncbi:hypothetical protein BT93_A0448 [Corymbia citriodora subsp. variegata]|nr:hypothetical protein BT93_A0448 [Corymbia citriodora subsp. variegata]
MESSNAEPNRFAFGQGAFGAERPLAKLNQTGPKFLSSNSKRAIRDFLPAQNPKKKLADLLDAHSQTSNDPGQPLSAEHLIVYVFGSFSNTLSLSSSDYDTSIFINRFSEESESIKTPVQRSSVSISSKQLLMEAATAISEDRADVAWEILTRLSAMPNPMGTYSDQKLIEYMLFALKSRVSPVDNPPPVVELFTEDHVLSAQSIYDVSPCFELGFMAANLAILEAASEQPSTNKLHVIDFDIGLERQYPDLLCALPRRQAGNQTTLKITTLADSFNGEERLRMVGDRLSKLAANIGVRLVFNIVSQKLSELSGDPLGCEANEVLAVNLAFKLYRMPDKSVSRENPHDGLLRCVKGLAPQVVTLVEQEMNGNTAPFMARVGEAMAYYGALLESIESPFPRDIAEQARVEEGLGWKLGNTVACEGRERVERCEVFGKWRARMEMAGFELTLGAYWFNRGYTVKEENGGVCLGWRGRTLTVASAWR